FDLISQLLQGSADPETIVRLFTLCMGRLTEPPGGGSVEGDKSLVGNGKATGLQALQQSTHGLFTSDGAVYRNQGLKEVKTNGVDVLHDDVFSPRLRRRRGASLTAPLPPMQMLASVRWLVGYLAV